MERRVITDNTFPTILFVLMTVMLFTPGVIGQSDHYRLRAGIGFDGLFRSGAITPLSLDISANEPLDGVIEILFPRTDLLSGARTYVRLQSPVSFSPGESVTTWFDVPLVGSAYPLEITLRDAFGSVVKTETIPLRDRAVQGPFILAIDPGTDGWHWLIDHYPVRDAPQHRSPRVARVSRAFDLPSNWSAYDGVDTVIISETFPAGEFSAEQTDALTVYVRTGGHLVFAGTRHIQRLPVQWRAWLHEFNAENTGSRIVSRRVGTGRITLLDVESVDSSLSEDDRAALAHTIFDHAQLNASRFPLENEDIWRMMRYATVVPIRSSSLSIGLALYTIIMTAIVIVATQYKRFFVVGIIVVLAAIGMATHVINESGLPGRLAYSEINIIHVVPGEIARQKTFTMATPFIRSGRGSEWFVDVMAPVPIPFPSGDNLQFDIHMHYDISEGPEAVATFHPSAATMQWTHTSVRPMAVTAHITDEEHRRLVVENNTNKDLLDAYYIEDRSFVRLGHVKAGTTLSRPYPPAELAGSGWIGANLQSGLLQQPPGDRPDDLSIRLLALSAEQAFQRSFVGRAPYVIGMIEADSSMTYQPPGVIDSWQVAIISLM